MAPQIWSQKPFRWEQASELLPWNHSLSQLHQHTAFEEQLQSTRSRICPFLLAFKFLARPVFRNTCKIV